MDKMWEHIEIDGDTLRKFGIDMLTGEACGYSMRILCDVHENGYALIKEFFGGAVPTHSKCNKGVNSIMLTRKTMEDIIIFGYLWVLGASAVISYTSDHDQRPITHYRAYYGEIDNVWEETHKVLDRPWLHEGRIYRPDGNANNGAANRSAVWGRVY